MLIIRQADTKSFGHSTGVMINIRCGLHGNPLLLHLEPIRLIAALVIKILKHMPENNLKQLRCVFLTEFFWRKVIFPNKLFHIGTDNRRVMARKRFVEQLSRKRSYCDIIAVEVNPVIHVSTVRIGIRIRNMRFDKQIAVW